MIHRNTFVVFLLIIANSLVALAQSKHDMTDLNLSYDFDSDQKANGPLSWHFSNLNLDESYYSTYTLEMMPGDSVRLIPEDGGSPLTGQVSKKVDLNFDGLDDYIINFGHCGNWGDCLYGIYVQQKNQKYTSVFLPEYWYSGKWDLLENEYNEVDGTRWMKLQLYSRTDYGGGPPGIVPTHHLQFDGISYQIINLQSLTK